MRLWTGLRSRRLAPEARRPLHLPGTLRYLSGEHCERDGDGPGYGAGSRGVRPGTGRLRPALVGDEEQLHAR
jgi:hypothetical protein